MKYHTTKKAVNNGYANRIAVGYCDLQSLLAYMSPVAYTTRTEGWAADIYEMGPDTVIVTGYAPFGNYRPDYDLTARYEATASKLLHEGRCNPETLRQLAEEYVAKVTHREDEYRE